MHGFSWNRAQTYGTFSYSGSQILPYYNPVEFAKQSVGLHLLYVTHYIQAPQDYISFQGMIQCVLDNANNSKLSLRLNRQMNRGNVSNAK